MRYFLRRPRAFWISVCNLVGLACSLAGVVLLLWFSVGPEIPGASTPLGAENGNEQLFQIESRRYGRNATIGLILVVAGTVLEAVPPFCTAWGSRRRRPNAAMPQTARESPMDPRVGEGPQLRAEAHHAAIDVIDAAPERIKLNQHWTENPEMVGLAVVGGVIRQQMAEVPFPNTTTWSRHSRRIEPISRST